MLCDEMRLRTIGVKGLAALLCEEAPECAIRPLPSLLGMSRWQLRPSVGGAEHASLGA